MDLLNELCMLNGTSGDEKNVREFIISKLPQDCTYSVDALGNLIVDKKGETTPKNKVALFAHMDEVGFIVTYISDDGYIYVSNVGGIDDSALFGKKLTINGFTGVAGGKAIHQCSADESKKIPSITDISVDFGFEKREEAKEDKMFLLSKQETERYLKTEKDLKQPAANIAAGCFVYETEIRF